MEESTTYQAIIRKGEARGRAEEARRLLLRLGQKQLGQPDAAVVAAVQAITDVERLEALAEQVLEARTWQQLLPAPAPRARPRGKRSQ